MKLRDLAGPDHPYHRAPRGMWLAARSPTHRPYPCRCAPGCRAKCLCRGRGDVDKLPASCCARRTAETAARKEAA